VGPNLFGVVGRPIASVAGYSYSMLHGSEKAHHGDWTPKDLNVWLKNPSSYAPGMMMTFAGLKSDQAQNSASC
jgi:cytochrome c